MVSTGEQKPSPKKKVLKDHKKVGNRFIPPMGQFQFHEISYVNQILPEIIWMGLINEKYGYRRGVELSSEFFKEAKKFCSDKKTINFALTSSYNQLNSEEKVLLVNSLQKMNILQPIQQCLLPLVNLYSDFPIRFIGEGSERLERASLIEVLRTCVGNHLNRYELPGMAIQTSVLYARAMAGALHIVNTIEPPDLDSIITSPDSEKGKRSAAFVRSTIMTEFGLEEEKHGFKWSESFWNQNYKLDRCNFYDRS